MELPERDAIDEIDLFYPKPVDIRDLAINTISGLEIMEDIPMASDMYFSAKAALDFKVNKFADAIIS